MLPYVQKIESGSRILACYWLIPHSNFSLDTFQYSFDSAVMSCTYCFTRREIKVLPNDAHGRLSECCFAQFLFCLRGFLGWKVLCQMNWSLISAKSRWTLHPFRPLFLTSHHTSRLSLPNIALTTHICALTHSSKMLISFDVGERQSCLLPSRYYLLSS